jgi:hypothetical protein
MYTQYFHYIHPLTPFPHLFPLPTGTNPPPTKEGPVLPSCSLIL